MAVGDDQWHFKVLFQSTSFFKIHMALLFVQLTVSHTTIHSLCMGALVHAGAGALPAAGSPRLVLIPATHAPPTQSTALAANTPRTAAGAAAPFLNTAAVMPNVATPRRGRVVCVA